MLSFIQTVFRTLAPVVAFLLLLSPHFTAAFVRTDVAVIRATKLNMRQGPGPGHTVLCVLKKDMEVDVLERKGGWLKIMHQDMVGYISNQPHYVEIFKKRRSKTGRPDTIEQVSAKAETITRKIEEQKVVVQEIARKESDVLNALNDIELRLNNASRQSELLRKELADVETEIGKLNNDIQRLMRTVAANESYSARRLAAIYKLNLLGSLHLLASSDSIYEMLKRRDALERILAHDQDVFNRHMADKQALQSLLDQLNIQKNAKIELDRNLGLQIAVVKEEKTKRSQLLDNIRSQKSLTLASIAAMEKAAGELDRMMTEFRVIEEQSTKIPEEPIATTTEGRKPFADFKGLLKMPVEGKIISHFGPYRNDTFNVVNFRSGIEIEAERGEPIRAVGPGRVLYASWFKGYGNMIIIDHDDHYYTVYAHAEELFKNKGEAVEIGEVIATVGDTASINGTNLYFEVRHHGKPVNPIAWLENG